MSGRIPHLESDPKDALLLRVEPASRTALTAIDAMDESAEELRFATSLGLEPIAETEITTTQKEQV